MAITWLSSYPKSGNTWVRFMIANMLAGPLDSTEHLQAIVPDMHEPLSAVQRRRWAAMPRQVTKTHHVYREGEPYQGRTAGIISVVRNPLDVLASGMNFRLLTRPGQQRAAEADAETARREYVDAYLRAGGDPAWIAVGFGSWAEHVRSWERAAERYRTLRLRYEDILADPHAAAVSVGGFLGLEMDDAGLVSVVEASGFARMREIERREVSERRPGFFRERHKTGVASRGVWFTNRGTSGGGRAVLTEEEVGRAMETFGGLMSELGYADPRGGSGDGAADERVPGG